MALSPKKSPVKASSPSDQTPSPISYLTPAPQGRELPSLTLQQKLAPPARRSILEEVLPSFQPPPPGEALPGKTTIKIRGVRTAVPILYYTC